MWTHTFKSSLKESRKRDSTHEKAEKRKLNIPAGRGIEGFDVMEEEYCNDASKSEPRTSKSRMKNSTTEHFKKQEEK